MHVFIAGVMQGARLDDQVDDQNYRVRITKALQTYWPDVHISDPWALNPGSVDYDEGRARRTFLDMTALAGKADLRLFADGEHGNGYGDVAGVSIGHLYRCSHSTRPSLGHSIYGRRDFA